MTTTPDAMSLADRGDLDSRYLAGPIRPNEAPTGVPAQRSEALSRVLSVLEDGWHAIRARHPQIPPVVIIIASGTSGRGAKWGHFDPRRWNVDATGTLAEVLISGEGLSRGELDTETEPIVITPQPRHQSLAGVVQIEEPLQIGLRHRVAITPIGRCFQVTQEQHRHGPHRRTKPPQLNR